MAPQLALFITAIYVVWLFANDVRRRAGISAPLWSVVLWLILIGSRPVSSWLGAGGDFGSQVEAYDAGNPLERMVYFVLIFYGLIALVQRGVSLRQTIRHNAWAFAFFLYWGLSIVWADSSLLAFKRWVKDLGNVVMVLIVLSEADPIEAAKAVFVRCASLLIPVSFLLIQYFSDLGRTYHVWTGEMMYIGVTTHKNSLGTLALVCLLFLGWDFVDRWRDRALRRRHLALVTDLSLIGLTGVILLKAHSATALACAAVGALLFASLGRPTVRRRIRVFETIAILVGGLVWLLDTEFGITRFIVVDLLGRDLTLTTRTEVWPVLLSMSDSLLFGTGFNSFWSGDRLATLLDAFHIIQSHNGYLETYLNGGALAIVLLIGLLLSAARDINRALIANDAFARMRLIALVTAIAYNFTEAAFNKMTPLWFALLLAILHYPRAPAPARAPRRAPAMKLQPAR